MEETNWTSIESKVRKIVKDIIEPTIRRSQETRDLTEKLFRKEEATSDRINSMEVQVAQTMQRLENISHFSGKIIESEANLRSVDQKLTGEFEKLYQKLSAATLETVNLSDKFRVLDNQRLVSEENVSSLEKSVLLIKTTIESRIDEVKERFDKKIEILDLAIRSSDSIIKQLNRKLESISTDLSETDYLAKKADRVTSEHADKFQQVSKLIQANKKELQESIEKLRNSVLGFNKDHADSQRKLLKHLETDYKVGLNMGMIEHLYAVTSDPRALHKLALHEREKLHEWGISSLQHSMKETIEKCKKRCQVIIDTPLPPEPKKNMFNADSKESLQHSSSKEGWRSQNNLKSPTEENLEESNEELKPLEPEPLSYMQPYPRENNFPSPRLGGPETVYIENNYSNLEIIDYMPYIQELTQSISELKIEISEENSKNRKKFQQTSQNIEEKFLLLQTSQTKFIENSRQSSLEINLLLQEALHECSMVSNLRKRDLSDMTTNIQELSGKLDGFIEDFNRLDEGEKEISRKINSLMEICKINMYLQKQDEVDRESISLMGYKESKPNSKGNLKKSVVSIDKLCQSCTGQTSIVLSAFKMACLAYTPSNILYSSQIFTRKELIDIQKRIIEGINGQGLLNSMTLAIEEKQKNRAKSAYPARRFRPLSVAGLNVSNIDIYSSIASDLPLVQKKSNNF